MMCLTKIFSFNHRNLFTCAAALFAYWGVIAPAASASLDDYAWAFDVEAADAGDIVQIRLPLSVYQSLSDARLRDLAVFNGDDEALIRVIESPARKKSNKETRYSLVVLPLSESQAESADEVRLMFERLGADVRLELADSAKNIDEAPTTYLLDTSDIKQNLHALTLGWRPVTENFVARIDVEGSNDLDRWSSVGGASIAWLERGASVVKRDRVALRSSRYDYLRIRVRDVPNNWRLESVNAIHLDVTEPEPTAEHAELARERDPEDGGWLFDLRAHPPVEQVQLLPTSANTVLSGRLLARATLDEDWRQIAKGSFYRLGRNDTALVSAPQQVSQTRLRYWKFVAESGNLNAPVELIVRWRADSLYFLARGKPPYTLAAGRAEEAQDGFPMHTQHADRSILQGVSESRPATLARLSERRVAGGPDRLKPRFGSGEARRIWLLWGGLILGVAIVGFMAVRLVRDLKNSGN